MEENIGMWLELRKSGWQFWKLPLQAIMCYQYVGYWILPNGQIFLKYRSKSKYPAPTIWTNFINFKNIVLVFTLLSKPLKNRWQRVTNSTTVHGNHRVNIQTIDISTCKYTQNELSCCILHVLL